ncbi:MAG: aminoacyl-tRNA hydrolase [Coriobacteriales bacterium]|jgi:PTH1 family peptidyl-tRNA hydrolase|nr:aminoacyl-tRNA hydrolase [Coriobacteriales bacterium]
MIVGLGNPGPAYVDTRHNAGFRVVDLLADELKVNYWKLAGDALMGVASCEGEKVVLLKPQSFMNLSGGPVKGALARLGLSAVDMLVIHDELDLSPGTLRLKLGGGAGGHKGLRSLHQALGSDYARLRVGIGRPPGRMDAADFVLARMKGSELEEFALTCARAAELARAALKDGILQAMNEHHAPEPAPAAPPAASSPEPAPAPNPAPPAPEPAPNPAPPAPPAPPAAPTPASSPAPDWPE